MSKLFHLQGRPTPFDIVIRCSLIMSKLFHLQGRLTLFDIVTYCTCSVWHTSSGCWIISASEVSTLWRYKNLFIIIIIIISLW